MLGLDPLVISWSTTSEVVEEKKEEKMQQMKCLVLSLSLALLIVGLLHLQLQNEVALLKANQDSPVAWAREVARADGNPILIYNRVPKTGSTSLMNVAYELQAENSFRVVGVHVTQFKHQLTLQDQLEVGQNMTLWSREMPVLYHGHFAHFNLRKLGLTTSPIYINLIRRPLDRLVSHYYFLRYGDDVLTSKVRAREGDTTSFDDCVEQGGPDCDPKKMWLQIPFFCGSSPQCWEPGSEWALARAKATLAEHYLLVGQTEDLASMYQVLELLLPTFFKGTGDFLKESGKEHIKNTRHKEGVHQDTLIKMRKTKIWKLENDFYNFAAKHFASVKKVVMEQKSQGRQFYNFEKIRPRTK